MLQFDDDGDLFYEKCVDGFLPELFDRWRALDCTHIVSIVFFGRVIYDHADNVLREPQDHNLHHPKATTLGGIIYRDFYRVCVEWEVKADWSGILNPLRKELQQFHRYCATTSFISTL